MSSIPAAATRGPSSSSPGRPGRKRSRSTSPESVESSFHMRRAVSNTAALLAALLFSLTHAAAQSSGGSGDLARRTFLNAEQLMREGKVDQALKDYMQVVSAFADTPYADDALLRLGSHHYPPETIGELRSVTAAAQDAARPYFVQIRERYPNSDSAPHALFKLGLLSLEPDSPKRNLDE